MFENDVKMYGIQAIILHYPPVLQFENDVKMYGIQAAFVNTLTTASFENDVKMYGIQANRKETTEFLGLRMM